MKTYEQLKALKYEEFTAPKPVLCYGGGEAFGGIGKYMITGGINIVGVIDAKKTGTVEVCGKKLSFLSMETALERFGKNSIVIITIADEEAIRQVEQNLVQCGFDKDKIFDLNVWTWLTTPSEKSYCPSLGGYMQFMQCALSTCCNTGIVDAYLSEWFVRGRPVEKSIENFLAKRQHYIVQSKNGKVPLYCRNCSFLSQNPEDNCDQINQFIISDHAVCNADCIYCGDACSEPKKQSVETIDERYNAIIKTLEALQKKGLLDKHAVFQVAGGEITVHPYKRQIYSAVRESPDLKIQFLSNCFIYDPEISNILASNRNAYLQCDLDAGTPETYIKVKGFNKFQIVKENLKNYALHGAVRMKYVILPDWNDTDADYKGTVELLNDLGIKQLQLSPEFSASREGSRAEIRKILFAASRFMVVLEEGGIDVVMPSAFWQNNHITIVQRLFRELQDLKRTSESFKREI